MSLVRVFVIRLRVFMSRVRVFVCRVRVFMSRVRVFMIRVRVFVCRVRVSVSRAMALSRLPPAFRSFREDLFTCKHKERSRHGGGDGPQGNWILIRNIII